MKSINTLIKIFIFMIFMSGAIAEPNPFPDATYSAACGLSCERNYTVISYDKLYLYEPTLAPIVVHVTVEPAEFLDLHNRSLQYMGTLY